MVQRDASIVGIDFSTDCIRFRQKALLLVCWIAPWACRWGPSDWHCPWANATLNTLLAQGNELQLQHQQAAAIVAVALETATEMSS